MAALGVSANAPAPAAAPDVRLNSTRTMLQFRPTCGLRAGVVRRVVSPAVNCSLITTPPPLIRPTRHHQLSSWLRGRYTTTRAEPESVERVKEPVDEVEHEAVALEEPAATDDDDTEGSGWQRWAVVFTIFLAFILCNMDKVNMSVAVIPMAKELGWSATDRGLVSSSFFWGYSLTQIPAGYLATRLGGARVLLAGVLLWSLGTLIAPPATQYGLAALCATRVLVGLGEGLAPSAATNVMANTIPVRERARAVSTVFGGLDVGSACGLLLCGPLIAHYGWPSVFYVFAGLGFIWCLAWPRLKIPFLRSSSQHPINEQKAAESEEEPAKVPYGSFMKSPAVWAIICAHFCFNWGYYTLLAWLPSYFELALGLDVAKSSVLTLIPYLAMSSMTPLVGPVADGMVGRGMSVTRTRKICQGVSFLGPALCMLACAKLTPAAGAAFNAPLLVGILSLAFALGAWARAGLYCNHQDLSPKYAGALLGITNTFGAFPGVLGVTSAGILLDMTNSWALALFLPTAACQIIGLIVYSLLASSEPRKDWA